MVPQFWNKRKRKWIILHQAYKTSFHHKVTFHAHMLIWWLIDYLFLAANNNTILRTPREEYSVHINIASYQYDLNIIS